MPLSIYPLCVKSWTEVPLYFGRTPSVRLVCVLWTSSRDYMLLIRVKIALLKTVGSLKIEFGVEIGIGRIPPRDRAINEVSDLVSLIGNLILSAEGSDKWLWSYDDSGKYNVKTLSSRIQLISLSDHIIGECHRRNYWIPHAKGDLIAKTIEEDVFPALQRVSKTWIAARLPTAKPANWNNWISKPFELFS
ncbi:hypothetical protein Tco_1274145 [Tanacetum coccineum]